MEEKLLQGYLTGSPLAWDGNKDRELVGTARNTQVALPPSQSSTGRVDHSNC